MRRRLRKTECMEIWDEKKASKDGVYGDMG